MASTDVVNPLSPQQNDTDRLADSASSPSAPRANNDAAEPAAGVRSGAGHHQQFLKNPRLRETKQLRYGSGFPMLLPVGSPRFLMYFDAVGKQLVRFDLTAAGAPDGGPEGTVVTKLQSSPATAAVSADGGSMCVNQRSHLLVFDTAQLLAARAVSDDPATWVQPRARTAQPTHQDGNIHICGAAFSDDGGLLYAVCQTAAAITVHDVLHSDLPRLRTLPFMAGDSHAGNYLLTSGAGLLAAAGGGPASARADLNARTVRVWRVSDKKADEETVLHTLELESVADAVAIRPDGEQFAIGLRDGTIKVFLAALAAGAEARLLVELDAPATSSDGVASGAVNSLCFGPDGATLAAGRADGTFMVYDMAATAATVNVFTQPKSAGASLAFAGRDFLVTGGGNPGKFVVRSLRPPPALCTIRPEFVADDGTGLSLPASINNADMIAGADRGATLISVASGSHVEVSAIDGEVLLARDLGAEMSLLFNNHSAVRLRPGGGHIACGLSLGKEVVVLSIADGAEAARISPEHQGRQTSVAEMRWSSDGSLLLLASSGAGVTVLAAERKFAAVQRLIGPHESLVFIAANFNQSGSHLVTYSNPETVIVWDVATWAQLHLFDTQATGHAVCLSPTADRVAYATGDGTVVVRAVDASSDDDEVHLQFSNVNGWADLSFSPDGDFLLVCPSDGGAFDWHKMRVLDLKAGADAEWGAPLRAMALPASGGVLHGRTVGWIELKADSSADGQTPPSLWMLYGAVGSQFVVADIKSARDAIEDAAWSVERLALISEEDPEHAGTLASVAPHCVNIRDPTAGETLLHRLARTRQVQPLQMWLGHGATVVPVVDVRGRTAVSVALEMEQVDIAQSLWRGLVRPLNILSASSVLNELQMLTRSHPHLVGPYLQEVEPAIVKTVVTFRTELLRPAEVVGWPTASFDVGKAVLFEQESVSNGIPAAWRGILSATKRKTLVASKASRAFN
eukprot:SAG31_NODE_4072_length_3614_cov_7.146230_2_plen_969_part_00